MQEAIRHGGRADSRPTREQIEPAARALVQRHSVQLIATARRYSLSAEDAEDAYQRGLEIMLTRAPSLHENDLVPWLKTVVKHEAFAIRKQRQRAELAGDPELVTGLVPPAHEQAERLERLRVGVEAMSRLKPQEVRCLLLRAEGYSYKQICDETGWTYTKVNRCISEGRRSFMKRVAGIESGAECERMAPLLSRLADGEASAEDMAAMRPHLRSCLACRATLRDFRAAPPYVAAFAPLLATPHLLGRALRRLQDLLGFVGAHKSAAVLGVAGALAGGGVAAVHTLGHGQRPSPPEQRHTVQLRPPVARSAQTSAAAASRRSSPARATHHRSARRRRRVVAQRRIETRAPAPVAAPPRGPSTPSPAPPRPAQEPARPAAGSEFGP
jgi:RNA polymerase sigma factor (sigma-70 family)